MKKQPHMEKQPSKEDWKLFADRLIKECSPELGEAMSLESGQDFVYLSDLESYELYTVNGADERLIQGLFGDYRGKKCYEVLQGRKTPCPFCTNQLLSREQFYVWKQHDDSTGREFIRRDKLVSWEGRTVRLEIITDVTKPGRMADVMGEILECQNLITGCLQCFISYEGLGGAFQRILCLIRDFYQADRAAFAFFGSQGEFPRFLEEGNKNTSGLLCSLRQDMPTEWVRLFEGGRQIYLPDTEGWRKKNPEISRYLSGKGIRTLCFTPLMADGELKGVLELCNMRTHKKDLNLLNTVSLHVEAQLLKEQARREAERALYYDLVTGYRSFEWFKPEAERLIRENPGCKYSFWYGDLKNFKYINDVFGYDEGNRILQYLADWMEENTGDGEAFTRVSADNFCMLLRYREVRDLEVRFENLKQRLAEYAWRTGLQYNLEVAVGVYLLERNEAHLSVEEMQDRANIAQKSIKRRSGSGFSIYSEEMRSKILSDLALEAELRSSMDNQEFVLYIQPQISLKPEQTGSLVKAEVLVRWMRDGKIYAMPGDFIPLFEQNGMIAELDYHIFEKACGYLRELNERYGERVCLSVNVSRVTLMRPGFVSQYCETKKRYGIGSGQIELEFTENMAVDDYRRFRSIIKELRGYGFLCAMDDFGTGHSSLNVLKNLPIDALKLDRLFFAPAEDENRGRAVIESVFYMARKLGISTVAEGIEHENQVEMLRKWGCDYVQGFLYSRPVPAKEFEARYLQENRLAGVSSKVGSQRGG